MVPKPRPDAVEGFTYNAFGPSEIEMPKHIRDQMPSSSFNAPPSEEGRKRKKDLDVVNKVQDFFFWAISSLSVDISLLNASRQIQRAIVRSVTSLVRLLVPIAHHT